MNMVRRGNITVYWQTGTWYFMTVRTNKWKLLKQLESSTC